MWLDNGFVRFPRRTFFLILGAKRIQCGVFVGKKNDSARWLQDTLHEVTINEDAAGQWSMHALLNALKILETKFPSRIQSHEIRVVVADAWLAETGVPWSQSMLHRKEAFAVARANLAEAGFDVGASDVLKLDDAPFGSPRFAVAYPAVLLEALQQLAHRLNSRLSSLLPLSIVSWACLQKKIGAKPLVLIMVHPEAVIVARKVTPDSACLAEVIIRPGIIDCNSWEQSVRDVWRRLCLREPQLDRLENVPLLNFAGKGVFVAELDNPFRLVDLFVDSLAKGVSQELMLAMEAMHCYLALDAIHAAPPLNGTHWISLGAIALGAGLMTLNAMQEYSMNQSLAFQLGAIEKKVSSPAPRVPWTKEDLARVQAVNVAVRQINMPVGALLHALEPPQDIRVAVLNVEASSGVKLGLRPSIKIEAEAPSGQEMTRYVAFVAERKPFVGAYLVRHEVEKSDKNRSVQPYRFVVEAQWTD